jgi:hypothetical protein
MRRLPFTNPGFIGPLPGPALDLIGTAWGDEKHDECKFSHSGTKHEHRVARDPHSGRARSTKDGGVYPDAMPAMKAKYTGKSCAHYSGGVRDKNDIVDQTTYISTPVLRARTMEYYRDLHKGRSNLWWVEEVGVEIKRHVLEKKTEAYNIKHKVAEKRQEAIEAVATARNNHVQQLIEAGTAHTCKAYGCHFTGTEGEVTSHKLKYPASKHQYNHKAVERAQKIYARELAAELKKELDEKIIREQEEEEGEESKQEQTPLPGKDINNFGGLDVADLEYVPAVPYPYTCSAGQIWIIGPARYIDEALPKGRAEWENMPSHQTNIMGNDGKVEREPSYVDPVSKKVKKGKIKKKKSFNGRIFFWIGS